MIQTVAVTMAASLKASTEGLVIVDKARCKKAWSKTETAWADIATTSKATLKRFWGGVPIRADTFKEICKAVGVEDWERIAEDVHSDRFDVHIPESRLSFAIAGSIEKLDKHKLDAIVALLNKLGGDTSIEILDLEEGSINLILGGSKEALNKIESLFKSGQLSEVEDVQVCDVHHIQPNELVELLNKNGGEAINLRGSSLRDANLRGATLCETDLYSTDLRDADLTEANLTRADLRGSDLRDTNLYKSSLHGANLYMADLRRADLTEANLTEADLRGANLYCATLRDATLCQTDLREADLVEAILNSADLRKADLHAADLREAKLVNTDLSETNLYEADLRGANLRRVNLRDAIVTDATFGSGIGLSAQEKRELVARGAIFDETSDDREFDYNPVPSGRRN